jgi:hypothetical protein
MTTRAATCAIVASIMLAVLSAPSLAGDLKPIAEFVRPAYVAMTLTMLCARDDPWFLTDSSGPRGNPIQYAEHVKNEAILSLNKEDALTVLKTAAEDARHEAQREFHKVVPTQDYRYPQIAGWCRSYVLKFVRNFISTHDANHTALLRSLHKGKQTLNRENRQTGEE